MNTLTISSMDSRLNKQQVCDSKIKHSLISAQNEAHQPCKGLSMDYYLCTVCGFYHVNTINKSVAKKRIDKNYLRDEKQVYLAKKFNLKRKKK